MEMLDHHCEEVFDPYVERLKRCREELGKCEHIRLAETKHYDKSKLVLSVAGFTKGLADTYGAEATGIQLQEDLLNQYHLQMEMAAGTYVIAMTSVGDTDEGMKRLIKAIYELDKKYKPLQGAYNTVDSDVVPEEIKKSKKKEKNYDIEPGHLPQAEVNLFTGAGHQHERRRGRWVSGCAIDTERRLHFRGVRVSLSAGDPDAGAGGTDHSADPGTFSMVYGKNI